MDADQGVPKRPSTFPLFSQRFCLQPQPVLEYFGMTRRQLQDYIEAFRRRLDIEQAYSKGLEQCSKLLDRYIEPGTEKTLSFACSAFKVAHEQKAHQSKEFSGAVKAEIIDVCLSALNQQTQASKRIENQLKRFQKELNELESDYQNSSARFEGTASEVRRILIQKSIIKYSSEFNQERKSKIFTKIHDDLKDKRLNDKQLANSTTRFNSFAQIYNKDVTGYLDEIENFIREQLSLETDMIRKLIVCEISAFKNIEYDAINISKQMETLDTQRDVELFTDSHSQNREKILKPFLVPKEAPCDALLTTKLLKEIQEDHMEDRVALKKLKTLKDMTFQQAKTFKKDTIQQDAPITVETTEQKPPESAIEKLETPSLVNHISLDNFKALFIAFRMEKDPQKTVQGFKKMTEYIYQIWNKENYELTTQIFTEVEDWLGTSSLHRLLVIMFLFELRSQSVVVNPLCLQNIAKVLECMAKISLASSDVTALRGVLDLIFTYYELEVSTNKKRPIFHHQTIHSLEIWKKQDFWEAAIMEATFEEMVGFTAHRGGETQVETALREKNAIFSQLASYCHYMTMLGIVPRSVRAIVGRFCTYHGMTDQQNLDLSKMITNAFKQYKEHFQTESKGDQSVKG